MRFAPFLILIFWCFCFALNGYAQEHQEVFRGQVVDAKTQQPVQNAIISLFSEDTSRGKAVRIAFGSSDSNGRFQIKVLAKKHPAYLEVRLMGYKTQRVPITSISDEMVISLEEDPEELPEVIVLSSPITSTGDTITYRATAFITNDTYSAEDLIKRFPGVTVDPRGIISYMGDPIKGVYIEGLDLVADSYQTATRIIKAEDISAVDVMERFQDKKVLRGAEEGDGTMLNIRLKDSQMLTPSGEVIVGGGVLGKKDIVHSFGTNTLLVNNTTQILGAGIWDTSATQNSETMGARRSIPNTSAQSLVGSTLMSHADVSQSLSQKDALGTLNQIFVLRDNVTLKYNIGYGHKTSVNNRGKESFLAHEGGYIHFRDENTSRIKGDIARILLNYTENSDNSFLLNTLTIEGDWQQGIHDIKRNETFIEQAISREIRLENIFNLITRKGDNTSTFEGKINYRRLLKASFNIPNGRYAYHQSINGSDLSAFTRAGYEWSLGGLYSIWGTIDVAGYLEDIHVTLSQPSDERSLKGGRLQVSSAPTLSYNSSRFKWSISVPLYFNYHSYHFQDFTNNPQLIERGKLHSGVSAVMSYRPTPLWYISWNARYTISSLMGATDFFLGTYYSSFDQIVTKRDIIEPERKTSSAILDIEYRQPIKAMFGRLRVTAIRTTDNKIISRTLDGTSKLDTHASGEQQKDFYGSELYLSKQIQAIKSVISVSTEYAYSSFPMLIDGTLNKLSTHNVGCRIELRSTPLKWIEATASVAHNTTRNISNFGTFTFSDLDVKGGIICSFLDRWSAGLFGIFTSVGQEKSANPHNYTLLRGNISYRHNRFRIELRGDNLLNTQVIYKYSVDNADRYSGYFLMRPRQIVLSSYIKF